MRTALICIAAVVLPHVLFGQSCAITSPTSGAVYMNPWQALPLTISTSSAPNGYKVRYQYDYAQVAEGLVKPDPGFVGNFYDETSFPFGATWYPSYNGDGTHNVSAILYDIFGNQVANCGSVSIIVNTMGVWNNSVTSSSSSGQSMFNMVTFDGTAGGANGAGTPYISGLYPGLSGPCAGNGGNTGGWHNLINTACYPNGTHTIVASYWPLGITDPYVLSSTWTLSAPNMAFGASNTCVAAGTCNLGYSGAVATVASTGTLPAPLVAGCQYYWAPANGSGATGTGTWTSASVSSNGTISVTLNLTGTACTLSTSEFVYLRNINATNQTTGQPLCDGYYQIAGVSGGNTFTVNSSNCPQYYGGQATSFTNFEVLLNPYCEIWNSATSVSLSTSFSLPASGNGTGTVPVCGSPLTLSGSPTGTLTVTNRVRSPYWGGANSLAATNIETDYVKSGAPINAVTQVTFSNGSAPMALLPCAIEYHGWPTKTSDPYCNNGTNDVLTLKLLNADRTTSALSCTSAGVTCTYSDQGVVTGQLSFNSSTGVITYNATTSWSVPTEGRAWGQIVISCSACASGGASLPSVTVSIENSASANNFPHYTTCGVIAPAFNSGIPTGCKSVIPLSAWHADAQGNTPFIGKALQATGFNAATFGDPNGNHIFNAVSTNCPTWPDSLGSAETWAQTNSMLLEYDAVNLWWDSGWAGGGGQASGGLPIILGNQASQPFNRQSCLVSLITHMAAWAAAGNGKYGYWRLYNDDEFTDQLGYLLMPNPNIGATGPSAMWVSAVVTGNGSNGIAFHLTNPAALYGVWSQPSGTGSWIRIVNATNSCLNGWYPILSTPTNQWISNNNNNCATGTYAPSGGSITETAAQMVINPSVFGNPYSNNQQNITTLGASNAVQQGWTATYSAGVIPGQMIASSSALGSITCSGSTCTVPWTGIGSLLTSGQGVRFWNLSSATNPNINGVYAAQNVTANSFQITCAGTSQQACPGNVTISSSSDPNLIVTIDPNWGPNPLQQFYNIIAGVPNHISHSFSQIGSAYISNNIGTYSWEGNSSNTDSAWVYTPNPVQNSYVGWTSGVNAYLFQEWGSDNPGGLQTRPWQRKPRSFLWGDGLVGGGASAQHCRSFTFNPSCDKASLIQVRREDVVAQIIGMKALNSVGYRLYNFCGTGSDIFGFYSGFLGWGYPGGYSCINQAIAPTAIAAAARTNAFLTLTADTQLQPEGNHPYFGPGFATDAHVSSTYGNSLMIACGWEDPYGSFTVNLPRISGGSTLKYILTGYSLSVTQLANNPTNDMDEFCSSPGRTTLYVSQPPGYTALDQIAFAPPMQNGVVALPFGASKFLVEVGYYPQGIQDDPVVDCTSGCTIAIDHHSYAAWYRVIYADSNGLPRSIGDPVQIQSQGLP